MQRPNGLKENECDAGKLYCDDEVAVEEQEEEERGCSGGFLGGGEETGNWRQGVAANGAGEKQKVQFQFH